ncbi:MAG: sigma 54-interacting transcriptional regulator, partial [Nannocystaceae bacterium]|nr:sigma 54-interacting transcriptional regulator [Nannocystaceae bacterium]
ITLVGIDPVEVPVSTVGSFGELRGRGSKMGELFSKLERLATIELDVLVIGETGTGKELVAQGLHTESNRSDGPFIVLDCTNLNEGIAESTLFGHRKGAFTGALTEQAGLLEQADGGTLFIDEIASCRCRCNQSCCERLRTTKHVALATARTASSTRGS